MAWSISWSTLHSVGIISLICLCHVTAGFCPPGWEKMEASSKCVKFTNTLSTGTEKYATCDQECRHRSNQLECKPLTIKNAAEQRFITSLFLNQTITINQDKNIWLGIRSRGDGLLEWADGDNLEYTNWQSSRDDGSCVVFIVSMEDFNDMWEEGKIGQWRQVACNEKHQVICEMRQKLPTPISTQDLLRKLDELKENLENSNLKINSLDIELKSTKSELYDAKVQLNSTKADLEILKLRQSLTRVELDNNLLKYTINSNKELNELNITTSNLYSELKKVDKKVFDIIPKGFVYIQYPNQNWATPMWPQYNWTEITHLYSGHFFRALGGGSASWEIAQEENAPRITDIDSKYAPYPENKELWSVSLSPGTSTARLWTGDDIPGLTSHVSTRFTTSGGEVRPKNYGIKIFRRD